MTATPITTSQRDRLTPRLLEILRTCRAEGAIHSSSLEPGTLWRLLERGYLKWETRLRDGWLRLTPRGRAEADRAEL